MTQKKNIIVGNWKMNLLSARAAELAQGLVPLSRELRCSETWIAPTFTALHTVAPLLKGSTVRLGAQNVHWAESGAFTGELSVSMLKELGVSFAIVGHSERRHVFGETNEICAKRAQAAAAGFGLVFCVGETAGERDSGLTEMVIEAQLAPVLSEITPERAAATLVAYEPVWAIGTGKVATPQQIEQTHQSVRSIWGKHCPLPCPPVLYGGSVAPDNFQSIIEIPGVDGALVGGASLALEKFKRLLEISEQNPVQ